MNLTPTTASPISEHLNPALRASGPSTASSPPRNEADSLTAEVERRILIAGDEFTAMLQLSQAQMACQQGDAKAQIEAQHDKIQKAIEEVKHALERARRAAKRGGFWGSIAGKLGAIAKIAGAVAIAASVVASGGLSAPAALVLAGLVLSSAGPEAAAQLGASDEVAQYVGYAGVACSVAGGGLAFAGYGAAGAAASGGTTAASVQWGASATAGLASAGGGYCVYREGSANSDELEAHADAAKARAHQRWFHDQVQQVLDGLKELQESFEKGAESLSSAQQEHAMANEAIANFGSIA